MYRKFSSVQDFAAFVFEHVPDIVAAFSELYRVLAPNGKLLFTVPCYILSADTKQRAGFENGALVHYHEPQYRSIY